MAGVMTRLVIVVMVMMLPMVLQVMLMMMVVVVMLVQDAQHVGAVQHVASLSANRGRNDVMFTQSEKR